MKKAIRWLLIIIFLEIFLYAGYQLVSTLLEYKKAENFYDGTAGTYVTDVTAGEDSAADAVHRMEPEDGSLPIYVKEDGEEAAPISVNFESLLQENSDVVGWLYSEDTVINYPVVQGSDNSYYLHRMLDGSYSSSGCIFMDYQCASDFSYDNSILYGHNMKNGSMFQSLLEYGNQEYYDEHPVMYLLTPEQNYAVKLVAGFVTDSTSWVYTIQFGSEESKMEYLEKAIASSTFTSSVTPTAEDRLLTLSTCSYDYDEARYVVIGVLSPVS